VAKILHNYITVQGVLGGWLMQWPLYTV